jgi:hypothetical protein
VTDETLLDDDQAGKLLAVFNRYYRYRGMVGDLLGPGGLKGFVECEPTSLSAAKKSIDKSNGRVQRNIALDFLRKIREIMTDEALLSGAEKDKKLPDEVADLRPKLPKAVWIGFCSKRTYSPERTDCDALLTATEALKESIGLVFHGLNNSATLNQAPPRQDAPLGAALAVRPAEALGAQGTGSDTGGSAAKAGAADQPRTVLPPGIAKVLDLAQWQFVPAVGSNVAGSDRSAFNVQIKIGEMEGWLPDAGVEVTYGIRQFQVRLSCSQAVPELAPALKSVEFRSSRGEQSAAIRHEYLPGSQQRVKAFRFEHGEAINLFGESEAATLFVVTGECLAGDRAYLEVQRHHLKVQVTSPDAPALDGIEERRIAENWLRNELYGGEAVPIVVPLCEQDLT